ncbi:outer membrane lipoprotein-sorting protein [bacterium]|nr:outer membrane lipoprotein-sorting protein [bacterium]
MQRLIPLVVALVFIAPAAAELNGAQILDKIDEAFGVDGMWSVATEVITTPEGESRTFTIESYTKNGNEMQLMRYLKPASVAGTTYLLLDYGDDIWAYFADTDRTRQIAANARRRTVMGSNMTYEDLAVSSNYADSYSAERLRSEEYAGVDCYVLKLIPRYSDSAYSKLYCWVDRVTWMPLRTDYYDSSGELLKRFLLRDIRTVDGIPTPYYYEMEGLQDGSVTSMTIIKVRYDLDIPDSLFSVSSLGK